jgi:hypothetical protein
VASSVPYDMPGFQSMVLNDCPLGASVKRPGSMNLRSRIAKSNLAGVTGTKSLRMRPRWRRRAIYTFDSTGFKLQSRAEVLACVLQLTSI